MSETDVPICTGDELQKSIVFEERETEQEQKHELQTGNNVVTLEAKVGNKYRMHELVDESLGGCISIHSRSYS